MEEEPIAKLMLDRGVPRRLTLLVIVTLGVGAVGVFIMLFEIRGLDAVIGLLLALLGVAVGWAGALWIRSAEPEARASVPVGASASVQTAHHCAALILEKVPDPAILLDPQGRIRTANAATRQIIRTAEPGRHIASTIRTPSLLDAIEQVRSGEPAQIVAYTVPVPLERHLQAHILPLRFPGDPDLPETWSTLIVIRDLTAFKRLEQTRADFIASASHELRTPLASLAGFIDTLQGHARSDPEAQERFIQIMGDQVARMGRLINDLLSLSRIELNEHVPPATPVDLHDVLRDVADAMAPLARQDGVVVDVDADPGLKVLGDRDELTQVFQNLVHNAIKYAATGKKVEIQSARTTVGEGKAGAGQPMVIIHVRDYGPGIDREHIPRLTERFYRVDTRQSMRRGGTGLGLAIVKHIVNRHRGSMEITSAVGEGSTFTIRLPLVGPDDVVADPVHTVFVSPGRDAVRSSGEPTP
ncbi:MAG: ATP-binding protein [Alphaproteobacteria bacterium]